MRVRDRIGVITDLFLGAAYADNRFEDAERDAVRPLAQLCVADGEFDLDEDEYIPRLARALGMGPTEYEDIVLDYELHDLRESFEAIRHSSVEPPPPA